MKRPREEHATVVHVAGARWAVTSGEGYETEGTLEEPSEFWAEVSNKNLNVFEGAHIDPYSPDYSWTLEREGSETKIQEGYGSHFGAGFKLLKQWNLLAGLLERFVDAPLNLSVDRKEFEKEEANIRSPFSILPVEHVEN